MIIHSAITLHTTVTAASNDQNSQAATGGLPHRPYRGMGFDPGVFGRFDLGCLSHTLIFCLFV